MSINDETLTKNGTAVSLLSPVRWLYSLTKSDPCDVAQMDPTKMDAE